MLTFRLKNIAEDKMPLAMSLQKWKQGMAAPRHLHDFVEIIYILKGSGVNVVNERPFPIIAGDLYIVNCGATHSFMAASDLVFYNLMFHFSAFSKKELLLLKENGRFSHFFRMREEECELPPEKLFLPPPFAEKFKMLFDQLYKETRISAPGFQMNRKAYLILLITEICRTEPLLERCKVEASSDNQYSSLNKVMNFINSNFLAKLSLSEIAKAGNLSQTYISEFFKNKTGLCLVSYINTLKVEKARIILLERPELSVSEVAAQCGFDDPSYFTKVFRESTGFTPKNYRNISG